MARWPRATPRTRDSVSCPVSLLQGNRQRGYKKRAARPADGCACRRAPGGTPRERRPSSRARRSSAPSAGKPAERIRRPRSADDAVRAAMAPSSDRERKRDRRAKRSSPRDHVNIGRGERSARRGDRASRSARLYDGEGHLINTHCTCRRTSGPRTALNLMVIGESRATQRYFRARLRECSLHYAAAAAGAPAAPAGAAAAARQH